RPKRQAWRRKETRECRCSWRAEYTWPPPSMKFPADDDIHHVGAGCTRVNERASRLQRSIAVRPLQAMQRVQSFVPDCIQRAAVDDRAGILGTAVDAIGAEGKQRDILATFQGNGCRQCQVLAAPSP